MKNTLLFTLGLFLFSSLTFAQETSIKDFDLQNYVAPEIKYKTLDFGSKLSMNGYNELEDDRRSSLNTNANLQFYEYRNTKKVQSISSAYLDASYYGNWSKKDTVEKSRSNPSISLSYFRQSRFYNQNKLFFGLHGWVKYHYSPSFREDIETNFNSQHHEFSITPYISVGKGRIEPIESARQAMDILISLQKEDRLNKTPDDSIIDSLARVANRIRYKRFFDSRYKRIYQLEELDEAMQNMDIIDQADMVYFANLNDIWNFSPRFSRGSGIRYEGGLIPLYSINYYKNNEANLSELEKYNNTDYGIYGFFSFNRMKPKSYAWQSDILLDLTFGYSVSNVKWENANENDTQKDDRLKGALNLGWQFGYYPNTRTYAGITPYASISYDYDIEEKNKDVFGLNTGFRFNSYYYISPRLRIELTADIIYMDNWSSQIPSPFWNNGTNQGYSSLLDEKMISYSILFSFEYAIF